MSRTTSPRQSMVRGPMRTIRPITSVIRLISAPGSSRPASPSAQPGRSDAGEITGAAAATGAIATTTSTTGRQTFANTIRRIARASAITTRTSSGGSVTTIYAPAPTTVGISAARLASRCSTPEATARVLATALQISVIARATVRVIAKTGPAIVLPTAVVETVAIEPTKPVRAIDLLR